MAEHPPPDCPGSRQAFHLRTGLHLHIADFNPTETLRLPFEIGSEWLRFTFLCEGKGQMAWRISSGTATSRKVLPVERASLVSFSPDLEGTVCLPAGHRQLHFSILISQPLLNMLLDGRFQRIPHELQAIIDGSPRIDFFHRGPLSPVMHAAIHEILNCPYGGPLGLIYRENKTFELIAHKLAQIESAGRTPPPAPAKLRTEDIERVRFAKAILSRDLENPPRLFDLARAVGTSHTQLNRAFRRMYGTSVFGYLRQMRLEQARHLLELGRMNVTEAALAVGYNSLSSFSRAFSTHFGSKPTCFLNRQKGK